MIRSFLAAILSLGATASAGPVINLARQPGAVAFGNSTNGPFVFAKINDGKKDGPMSMWSTGGQAGAFGGVQLGERPVTFNTVRFYLFNGRSAFTGWRLEGSNDCQIDEDTQEATVYDPELIATDPDAHLVNCASKENNVVVVTFKPVSYKYVRLVFPNKSQPVGVPEIEVFLQEGDLAPSAKLEGTAAIEPDPQRNTLTLPRAAPLRMVVPSPGVTVTACDRAGKKLGPDDLLKSDSIVTAKSVRGGGDEPLSLEYKAFTVIDATAPPPVPKPYVASTRPALPPKPSMTPVSAPDAPKETVNLILGKQLSASMSVSALAGFSRTGSGDWFGGQRPPQWVAVDFGTETAFNYVAVRKHGPVDHFVIQSSGDGNRWRTLAEVDHVRKNERWNGWLEPTRARWLRVVLLTPCYDMHLKGLMVASLSEPLPGPALKPPSSPAVLPALPPAATESGAAR